MISAGLLVLSFRNLMKVDRGFEVGHSVTYASSFILTNDNYGTPEKLAVFADRVVERVSAVRGCKQPPQRLRTAPGVLSAHATGPVEGRKPAVQPSDLPITGALHR